jgi:hypothetical protein
METTKEAIGKKISSSDTSQGHWCIFVQISDTVGLKLYHSREMRDDTQALQETGHECGFAPKCWGEFEMEFSTEDENLDTPHRWKDTGYAFGYYTELVDIGNVDSDDSYELIENMSNKGFKTTDIGYYNNTGYCKKTGILLCYDWDVEYNNPDPGHRSGNY